MHWKKDFDASQATSTDGSVMFGFVAPPTPPEEEQRAKQLREVWRSEAEATQVWVWNWLERGGTRDERDAESQDVDECHESQLG